MDHDHALTTLQAFRDLIEEAGHVLPYVFALPPNAGLPTDIQGTSPTRPPQPDDAQGYGRFRGAGGLALLSRFEIDEARIRDFSSFLWQDLPDTQIPDLLPERHAVQRLSSTGHWDVPLQISQSARLHLLVYQAGPPVFGPADGWNRARNHDETAFWLAYLDGRLPAAPPTEPVIVMGGSNLDPFDGDGQHAVMRALLAHPRLQDPQPSSLGAIEAATTERDLAQSGPPEFDTVHWPQTSGPGNLRVSYILPDARLRVMGSGVFWPSSDSNEAALLGDPNAPPTRHRLIWVDLDPDRLN